MDRDANKSREKAIKLITDEIDAMSRELKNLEAESNRLYTQFSLANMEVVKMRSDIKALEYALAKINGVM